MAEEERKFTPGQETPLRVEEHERFGARVREILGGIIRKPSLFSPTLQEITDIEYITSDGKAFFFSNVLPKNWRLIRASSNRMPESQFDQKRIFYSETMPMLGTFPGLRLSESEKRRVAEMPQITGKGFLLILLHEIGHAHTLAELTPEEIERDGNLRKSMFFKKMESANAPVTLPPQERKDYEKLVIGNERDAWAWALKNLRRLRREGIDLEPELKTNKDLLEFIHGALVLYEPEINAEQAVSAFRAYLRLDDKTT